MYPVVSSIFGFSVTHEIVGKLVNGLELTVREINELAEADPDDPHRFEATMTQVRLQPCEAKPYMLERVVYEVSCLLFVKGEDGLVEFSRFVETLSEPVGPLSSDEANILHPIFHSVTLEDIYCGISRFVRHLYAEEARVYIWRDGTEKRK
jgi:hypothetical protein